MTPPRLTAAQKRALDWLPRDGSWRTKAGRLSAAINSLGLSYQKTVEQKWGKFGPRGGWESGYRLTPAGLAMFHPEPESGENT